MVRRIVSAVRAAGPALVLVASPLRGQAPGYDQIDTRRILAEYHAEVITQINRVMARWSDAWEKHDLDRLADLYWEEAVIIPRGEAPVRGVPDLRRWMERTLAETTRIEAFMLDFDASGGMAVVYGNYLLDSRDGTHRSGPVVTVFLQRGRTWRIRSQVFTGS
jgi:uncharacterized protein (TIGR02246 family)